MSTSVIKKDLSDYVIIRGYGNEPVCLKAILARPGVVEVVGSNEIMSMGFPSEDVFEFDQSLFNRLRTAYEAGDRQKMVKLWEQAKLFSD
jgi:hypothetical protein